MILVAVLLCTLLRGVRMQESKIAAITLLTQAAMHCDDDTRLQRIVPYLLVCAAPVNASCCAHFDDVKRLLSVVHMCMWCAYKLCPYQAPLVQRCPLRIYACMFCTYLL